METRTENCRSAAIMWQCAVDRMDSYPVRSDESGKRNPTILPPERAHVRRFQWKLGPRTADLQRLCGNVQSTEWIVTQYEATNQVSGIPQYYRLNAPTSGGFNGNSDRELQICSDYVAMCSRQNG